MHFLGRQGEKEGLLKDPDNHRWQMPEKEGEMLGRKGVAVGARNPSKVAVNEVSTETWRRKDRVGWPGEFPCGKEVWKDENVRKISGKIWE